MDDDKLPIRIPIAGTAAGTIFYRQLDDYSCGPACLTSLARLYDFPGDYDFYRAAAAPNSDVGTPAAKMQALGEKLFAGTYQKTGLDTYDGGIAIANIIQGEDHYVIFLKKEGERVIYYDPYEHEFVIDKLENIAWKSEKGDHDRWCMDFAPRPGNSIAQWVNMAAPPPSPKSRPSPPKP